jgi:hypothetical protein
MSNLINWSELSLLLTGKKENLRSNNVPKKYQNKVDRLISFIEAWQNDENLISEQKLINQNNELKEKINEIEGKISEIYKFLN